MSPIMIGSAPLITYLMKQAETAIRAHLDTVLRTHGLTTVQYTALTVLEHREGLSSAQLARRSFVKAQTMHELVLGLERHGLIAREPSAAKRHVLLIRLTADGRKKLEECHADVHHIERRMLANLTEAEVTMLRSLLERCHGALAPH